MKKHFSYWLLVALLNTMCFMSIQAESGTGIVVDPAETTVTLTWPTDPEAQAYRLDIYHDGAIFCKLTLGANGQLQDISFKAPDRTSSLLSPESHEGSPSVLSFMVTGLEVASRYNYVLSYLDANGTPLHVYFGDFATLGYTGELKGSYEVIPTPPIIPSNPEAKTPTGVEGVLIPDEERLFQISEFSVRKILRDGQLIVFRGDKIYTLSGQEVK